MTSNSQKNKKVVSNSSPIIHLARINRLYLLQRLFKEIIISKAVYREVVVEGRGKPGSKEVEKAKWIKVKDIRDTKMKQVLTLLLDEGEAEAIILALEINADLILLDEREARIIAKKLHLNVTGTLGMD